MTSTVKLAEIARGRTPQTSEQRRYEIAKAVMASMHTTYSSRPGSDLLRISAEDAVRAADALLAAIEAKEKA